MIREAIAMAAAGSDLSESEAAQTMEEIMSGEATPSQMAAFLVALRVKGESVEEITGMVRVMRDKAARIELGADVLDVVSTGGGGFDPFNISTAAALVCAGAGVRVAKHGNRGFTSKAGAADVLEALGAKLELEPDQVKRCLERSGFAFLFAQLFHPAMRFVGPTRREIGIRTVFNSLGPLTHPAGAQFQLIGAGDPQLQVKIAQVVARLGAGRVLIVHADDGLDELSLNSPTRVFEIRGHEMREYRLTPEEAGFARVPLQAVASGTAEQNAARMRTVFAGEKGPHRDYVLANAGLALTAAGKAKHLSDGIGLAAESIDSGAAGRALQAYVTASREP
jgi:anthranilate phosphoribosyltransferase